MIKLKGEQRPIDLTPAKAKEFLRYNYEYQRPLNENRMKLLRHELECGRMQTTQIRVAHLNGKTIMTDGQHSCHLVVRTKSPLAAVVTHYQCDSMDDVSALYNTHNPPISVRSLWDKVSSRVQVLGLPWSSKSRNLLVSGLLVVQQNFIRKDLYKLRNHTDRIEMIDDNIREGNFIYEIIDSDGTAASKHLQRKEVAAAMIVTWRKCQRDALEFWTKARSGEMLAQKDPRAILLKFLCSISRRRDRYSANTDFASGHEILCRCIGAWNAHRENRKITQIKYYKNKDVPKVK